MQSPTPSPAPRSWLAIGPGALGGNSVRDWPTAGSRFYFQHLWMPLTIFAGLSLVLMGMHGDL